MGISPPRTLNRVPPNYSFIYLATDLWAAVGSPGKTIFQLTIEEEKEIAATHLLDLQLRYSGYLKFSRQCHPKANR
jgi:hypothetical protein